MHLHQKHMLLQVHYNSIRMGMYIMYNPFFTSLN